MNMRRNAAAQNRKCSKYSYAISSRKMIVDTEVGMGVSVNLLIS